MAKVLLITDSEWVRNDVKATLTLGDWELIESPDPHDAVELTREIDPRVVVVDMQIANMGGMAVIRAIRSAITDGTRPRLVLLLDRSADKFLARRAGADVSLVKPFDAQAFRAVLNG